MTFKTPLALAALLLAGGLALSGCASSAYNTVQPAPMADLNPGQPGGQ